MFEPGAAGKSWEPKGRLVIPYPAFDAFSAYTECIGGVFTMVGSRGLSRFQR